MMENKACKDCAFCVRSYKGYRCFRNGKHVKAEGEACGKFEGRKE